MLEPSPLVCFVLATHAAAYWIGQIVVMKQTANLGVGIVLLMKFVTYDDLSALTIILRPICRSASADTIDV